MGYIVRMPQMGLEMEEGEVVEWTFEEGDSVEEGETIAVVESEKAANDVDAREDGTVRQIIVPEGGVVEPGDPIGIVAGADEDISRYEAELPDSATVESSSEEMTAQSSGAVTQVEQQQATPNDATETDVNVRATPGAKQLAEQQGIDLTNVDGTGPQGTITESDVEAHDGGPAESSGETTSSADVRATPGAKQLAEQQGIDLTNVDGTGPQGTITESDIEEYEPVSPAAGGDVEAARSVREVRSQSGIQQTVSERMSESHRSAPHVTLNRSFDARRLQTIKEVAATGGIDVSLNDLLLCALGSQLEANPGFNAIYEDGEYRLIEEVNIGVAVDIEDGLLTPVIPDVTAKSIESVAEIRAERMKRALSGDFAMDDLSGGTFTVTNLGMFGVDDFDPIINPPEVAILGVGRVRDDGTMTLSLSFDHRVVNGADAARFLDGLIENLTDTETLTSYFAGPLLAE